MVNNIGYFYKNRGKLAEAGLMFRRAMKGYEKTLGLDHTSTLIAASNLKHLHPQPAKRDRAEATSEQLKERSLGMTLLLS